MWRCRSSQSSWAELGYYGYHGAAASQLTDVLMLSFSRFPEFWVFSLIPFLPDLDSGCSKCGILWIKLCRREIHSCSEEPVPSGRQRPVQTHTAVPETDVVQEQMLLWDDSAEAERLTCEQRIEGSVPVLQRSFSNDVDTNVSNVFRGPEAHQWKITVNNKDIFSESSVFMLWMKRSA